MRAWCLFVYFVWLPVYVVCIEVCVGLFIDKVPPYWMRPMEMTVNFLHFQTSGCVRCLFSLFPKSSFSKLYEQTSTTNAIVTKTYKQRSCAQARALPVKDAREHTRNKGNALAEIARTANLHVWSQLIVPSLVSCCFRVPLRPSCMSCPTYLLLSFAFFPCPPLDVIWKLKCGSCLIT